MQEINVRIARLRVSSLSVRDGSVTVDIDFDDGKEKRVYRTTMFRGDVEQIATSIIDEIKKMEKNIHYELDDDHILKSYVNVLVVEEDITIEKIIGFLSKVREQMTTIKTAKVADGYMDMIKNLQSMKLEL